MANINDYPVQKLIEKAAKALESEKLVKMPDWAIYVKTSSAKERPPSQENWYYLKSAAILRQIYLKGPIGTAKLKTVFGSLKRRGHQPPKFKTAGGKIIRTILQQLEKSALIKQVEVKKKKGRVVTPKGKSFLDKLCKDAKQ